MDVPVLANQQELIYNSPVQIGCSLKTYQEQWMRGTNEERGKSMLAARLDDDDLFFLYQSIIMVVANSYLFRNFTDN